MLTSFKLPEFNDETHFNRFRAASNRRKHAYRVFFMILTTVFYAAHAILDLIVGGEAKFMLLALRFAAVIPMLWCIWQVKKSGDLNTDPHRLLVMFVLAPALATVGMISVIDANLSASYPYGLIIVLAASSIVLGLPFFQTALIVGISTVAFVLVLPFSQTPCETILILAFFMTVAIAVILISALVMERHERLLFLSQERLADARDDAIEAKQDLQAFLSSVSHELRTPLKAIVGYGQAIESQQFGPLSDAYRKAAADIQTSGTSLQDNIEGMLEGNQIKLGQMDWNDEVFSVGEVIRQSISMCQSKAADKQINIVGLSSDQTFQIRVDFGRMSRVMTNLITNSITFSEPGGTVTISAGLTGNGTGEISIKDNGLGMSKEAMAKIAEPFEPGSGGDQSNSKGGLGLGLAISSGILERMNGTLSLESEVGDGTTATITIPENRIIDPLASTDTHSTLDELQNE